LIGFVVVADGPEETYKKELIVIWSYGLTLKYTVHIRLIRIIVTKNVLGIQYISG
jgi:hypothetical protein